MEQVLLLVGIGAAAAFAWWILKKFFKLAIWAGIIGAAAWYWYFNIR